MTYGFLDRDGDGVVPIRRAEENHLPRPMWYDDAACCNIAPNGERHCGGDCNDSDGNVHPAQVDACNNLDDNCNGIVDECNGGCSFNSVGYRWNDPNCVTFRATGRLP